MAATKRVAAVVVTYNRKDLLMECIEHLQAQTAHDDMDILVIDNASTDGTAEVLAPLAAEGALDHCNTGSNLGGAGGFQFGLREAVERGYDLAWLMDDDCMPGPTALEELLHRDDQLADAYGFLSSKVLWRDGSICTMNLQRETVTRNVAEADLGRSRDLIPVEMASFVSLLVPARVVREVGLPLKEFFIWTDDWEYTRRISRQFPCYLVPASVVMHKSVSNIGANIATDAADRLDRYDYLYRNDVYLYRREGLRGFLYETARLTAHATRVLAKAPDNKLARLKKIASGTKAGFTFNPKIEYPRATAASEIRVLELFGEPISSGGQESAVSNFVSHMDMEGLHIDYLTPYYCDSERHRKVVEDHGGQVFALGENFNPGGSRFYLAKPLREFFASHPYDVVHIHSGSTTFLAIAAKAAKQGGTKRVIVHSHSPLEAMQVRNKLIRALSALLMNPYVDRYCACSRGAAVAKFTPSIQKQVMFLNNGVDLSRFRSNSQVKANTRRALGIANDVLVVGHVGRMCYEKNHTFLLDVFLEILAKGVSSHLLLLGDGELRAQVEQKVSDLGIGENVTLMGNVQNVEDYMQAMDILVFPSKYEGLPMVLVEAQAVGLPLVVSDCVTDEVLISNDYQRLSLSDSPQEWAEKTILLESGRNRLDQEPASARAFDADVVAAKVRSLYIG